MAETTTTKKRTGRPKTTPEKKKELRLARQGGYQSGTKEKVLHDLERYMARPDEPMVPEKIAKRLEQTRNMAIAPNAMFDDGGHKVAALQYLAARCAVAKPPKTREGVFESLQEYFEWSSENRVPITLGSFAVWNGCTQTYISKVIRDTSDPERARAYEDAKECIRSFLERCTLEGIINPIVWFHTHKTIYGAVENQSVTLTIDDNSRELTEAERQERYDILTLEPDANGVYSVPDAT